ncbi:hypothetical protein HELRODRAFT_173056 [Helobdella robusta]|uniref:Uncharacterized protein n=1 Tax=Helobdella robusta TaxID=6412 RepID=T1F6B1_HELRO|nr:hypothetical protein HELRODRAFT_173056 [Helobdella robusta]ESO04004.1 hypothetical protein HELRODRAFT_173056 [Helobdella robusta]
MEYTECNKKMGGPYAATCFKRKSTRSPHLGLCKYSSCKGYEKLLGRKKVSWVRNAWGKVTDSCVAKALKAGYLDKTSPFEASYIAKHDRLGPMILKELESNEILAGI